MATGATFAVINGQVTQVGVDPTVVHKDPVGTCINCGQANVPLSTHMGRSEHVRYICLSATQLPFTDPNQSSGVGKQTGSAGNKHR
jgi:hypothetical protein